MTEEPPQETTNRSRVVPLLVLSITMVSSASPLIVSSNSPALVIVFWRTLYGAIIMATVGVAKGDWHAYRDPHVKDNWYWLVGIGLVLSFHFSTWFQSLTMTTIAASVVLVNTSPMFTAIFSIALLGESIRRRTSVGILIACAGAFVLAFTDIGQAVESSISNPLLGDLLALISAVFLAIYFIGGQRYARGIPNSVYTSIVYLSAAGFTLAQCIILNVEFLIFEPYEVAIFLALAIFPTALGHSVNNYLLTLVPAYVISSAVLGEPIGATLLAIVFIGPEQIPTPLAFIGFIIILFGIGIVLADLAAKEREKASTLDDSDGT